MGPLSPSWHFSRLRAAPGQWTDRGLVCSLTFAFRLCVSRRVRTKSSSSTSFTLPTRGRRGAGEGCGALPVGVSGEGQGWRGAFPRGITWGAGRAAAAGSRGAFGGGARSLHLVRRGKHGLQGAGWSWASALSLLPPFVSWGAASWPLLLSLPPSPRGVSTQNAEIQPRCPGPAGSSPPHPSSQLLVIKPRERERGSDRQTDGRLGGQAELCGLSPWPLPASSNPSRLCGAS